jgi:tetratricopeptide (TPR) repeat protein
MHEWDWETAQAHADRALSLAPNDSFVLHRTAFVHLGLGRLDLAFTLAERSLTVDPMSAYAHVISALILYTAGNTERAIEVAEAGRRMQAGQGDLMRVLGLAYTYGGRLDDAVRVLDGALATSNRHPLVVGNLAVALARRGDVQMANALLDELLRRRSAEIVHSRAIGMLLMELGRVDDAFAWFDQAFDERDWFMAMWGVDHRLEPIRADPRWEEMRQRIGIPN